MVSLFSDEVCERRGERVSLRRGSRKFEWIHNVPAAQGGHRHSASGEYRVPKRWWDLHPHMSCSNPWRCPENCEG